jgi:hypothetical protein
MHILILLLSHSPSAFAQWQSSSWLHLGGAYSQRAVKEDAGFGLTSARAGAQGELGLNLLRFIAVSAAGTYQDGAGSVSAAKVDHFGGYASDTRALVHLIYAPVVVSTGLAEFESFETLPGVYRARTAFSYKPMMLTLNWGPAYLRLEQDLSAKGSITRRYSDAGGGRTDQKYELPKSRGQGARVGLLLPGMKYATHLFVDYHRWQIDQTAARTDGVDPVRVGSTQITTMSVGLGLAF